MSLRAAINGKCRDCIYDPKAGGTWLAQVACCSAVSCPLWPVRPAPAGVSVPRDPETVPAPWARMSHAQAIASLRPGTAVTAEIRPDSGLSPADAPVADSGAAQEAAQDTAQEAA
jgi:hypothetical protein